MSVEDGWGERKATEETPQEAAWVKMQKGEGGMKDEKFAFYILASSAFIPARMNDVLPIIQLAITPVILMSGIGAVLLSMTQRMGRIVDRTRILSGQLRQEKDAAEREHVGQQLTIMFRRAHVMRFAMTMATLSVFMSGLLVVVIFASAFTRLELSAVILGLFVVSVSLLLLGLAMFIRDIFISLKALNAEVARARELSVR